MSRLALLNILVGFTIIFLAASFGVFVAFDVTESFLRDRELYDSWRMVIERHSHGHTNLFAMIQILFGLTLSYSMLPPKVKKLQTLGFVMGAIAMGPMMLIRASVGPSDKVDGLEAITGLLLVGCFAALALHCFGILQKLLRR